MRQEKLTSITLRITGHVYRGGVLEPEGIVAIKYREKDVLATINRLDSVCIDILSQLKATDLSPAERRELESKLSDRQTLLLPMYHQVAVQFADLHDTAGRMKEKGVISVRSYPIQSIVHQTI